MGRKKSYSSELTRIIDVTKLQLKDLEAFKETLSALTADSERLHDIEPLLKDIGRVASIINPVTADNLTHVYPNIQPGTLCKTCNHNEDKDFDCTHDAAEYCTNHNMTTPPITEVKKRIRRAKKIITTGKVPPPDSETE